MRWGLWAGLLGMLAGPGMAQDADVPPVAPWPVEYSDPAAETAPADLILPLPCGAAMAFQKVTVPVEAADPLADRRVRLGQSLDQTGYADYLRPAFLRGPFSDAETGTTHYYIARYELTQGQYRALRGDCTAPTRKDRLAQGGLSWFDAVDIARGLTTWLYTNAPEAVPHADNAPGFLRLPTGDEWEYATRGGARIDATLFPGLTFFNDGAMRDFARYQAPGSARGKLGPVGLRKSNPLGLYDVYGNAEEMTLDLFRLNAIGRAGGQVGGIVTRGGSVLSTEGQIYSAQRTEYAPYDTTGAPMANDTFGLRLVLAAHIATSDSHLRDIRARWSALAGTAGQDSDADIDPIAQLAGLIEAETDPRRVQALGDLQLEFRRARDRTQTALQKSARSTLLAGAVFVETLIENAAQITDKAVNIRLLVDLQRAGEKSNVFNRQVQAHVRRITGMRRLQTTYLLSFRTALETLTSDISPGVRQTAYDVLREELSLSGQTSILRMLDRFWADLAIYSAKPDISPEDLLGVALN
ncbi:MAG: hypothetical protein ACI8R4_004149 [Paracoccaceae bacterium]|jgi:hypothetical protein